MVSFVHISLLFIVNHLILTSGTRHKAQPLTLDKDNNVFLQVPFSSPPTVRPPPYFESLEDCPEINDKENWIDTLCGDLNKGYIPMNPFGHQFEANRDTVSYPFEIMKNKTLQFFRHALPVLRDDKSLPKVARYSPNEISHRHQKYRRSVTSEVKVTSEEEKLNEDVEDGSGLEHQGRAYGGTWRKQMMTSGRNFCENSHPRDSWICKVYKAIWKKPQQNIQSYPPYHHSLADVHRKTYHPLLTPNSFNNHDTAESKYNTAMDDNIEKSPPTPCPSSAEYLTPVFARNHEGAWRYVVQIPREGYFTQTVEVTKCGESKCFYMDGYCRTSPRWQSLLVAELFYPEATFPVVPTTPKVSKRRGVKETVDTPPECDGMDDIGCFQVRLFYDWFLIPGSCKCWKRPFDFTNRNH